MSRLDLVIFGATGFTGKYAVVEMVRVVKKYPGMTWGVAGRSETKLQDLMLEVAKRTGEDLSGIKVIKADIKDEMSLKNMCDQSRVIVNCCGPYRLYGEPVVRAAIGSKTHYVDISGEPQFIETMQLQYDKQASDAGVYAVSACGIDSVPNDMAVVFLQQNFGGTLNSVESYVSLSVPLALWKQTIRGVVHYGTWESLVYSLANYGELKFLRKKLYPEPLPTFQPRLARRSVFHKRDNGWCIPFLGADDSIVYRTQRHLYEKEQKRPAQFKCYLKFNNLIQAFLLTVGSIFIYLMSNTKFTRKLLLDYPRLFTFGVVSHEGPTEAVMDATKFKFEMYGEGWDAGVDVNASPPNKKVVAQVSGTNPGYGATVTILIYSAITLLKETDKIPGTGGVLTSGAAFKNTNIISKLTENNVKFEIVESK